MKESKKLKQELSKEDNDMAAFALDRKIKRETRYEDFEEMWLPKIRLMPGVVVDFIPSYHYTIKQGANVYDFYPKSNSLLIRRTNEWVKPGLHRLIKLLNLNP